MARLVFWRPIETFRLGVAMCSSCQQFATTIAVKTSGELHSLHDRLYFNGVNSGVLEVVNGSLEWGDYIECTLQCVSCQQQFNLTCEIYHGSGGQFGPAACTQD